MDINSYYRKKRQKAFMDKFLRWLAATFLAITLFVGFLWMPFVRISKYNIENFDDISSIEETVTSSLKTYNKFFIPNNNFFLVSASRISNTLTDSGLGLAVVEKKFPKTLEIKFLKIDPWLIFCGTLNCFYVSREGIVSERAPKFSESPLPEITFAQPPTPKLGKAIISNNQSQALAKAFSSIASLGTSATRVEFEDADFFKIFLKEDWYIHLSLDSDMDKTFYDLKLLLEQKIKDKRANLEYIDMRFENKAFYKLR